MSINNVSTNISTLEIQSITSTSQQAPAAAGANGATNGVAVDISKPGQLMGELAALAKSNPDQFKAVTANIAQQLKDAASQQTGGRADFLNKLAANFTAASQSGDASDLTPGAGKAQGGGHHHGGGHHRVHAGGGGADQTSATGSGPDESIGQIIQGIISSALAATTASSSSGTTAAAAASVSSTSSTST